MDRSLQEQAATGPGINTLYVPIGKLHPRSEYVGVLINLNVAAAIKRGKQALELANTFLDKHKVRQKIGEYTGDDRVIHFLIIKRNQVNINLKSLEADLHSVHTEHRIPDKEDNSVGTISARKKRSINFDIEWDVNKCLNTIVQGVVSIFSSPRSLDKIQKTVNKIAYNTSRLESKFDNFTHTIDDIIQWMKKEMDYYKNYDYMITSIDSALNLADEAILELLNSITPLIEGKLTHNLLDPLRTRELIERTQQMANKLDLQVVAKEPYDILQCSVTTFATEKSWYALLSLPLVHRSETMNAYQFMNIPWFHQNISVQWRFQDGIVASQPGLYPDIDNIFIPQEDVPKVCDRFNNNYLCHNRINHKPNCQISLMNNKTEGCSLQVADHKIRYAFAPFNYLFFAHPTTTMVKCPNKTFTIDYHGLVNIDQISTCKLTTKNFTLLPKSTTASKPSFITKIKHVTLLDNEWIKVALEFDGRKKKNQPLVMPSWADLDNITTYFMEEDVKLFGSYTILVHSITLFFIVILLSLLFTVCIMNFFDYIPERFKTIPDIIESPQPPEDAESIASPDG